MEEFAKSVLDYVSALAVERWAEILVFGMTLAVWRWTMGYRLRNRLSAEFDEKLAAIREEMQKAIPTVVNVTTVAGLMDSQAIRTALREELDNRELNKTRTLRDTIAQLPQRPLGDGHMVASLPDGTNVVTMADGALRLVFPVRLSANFEGGLDGSLDVNVSLEDDAEC